MVFLDGRKKENPQQMTELEEKKFNNNIYSAPYSFQALLLSFSGTDNRVLNTSDWTAALMGWGRHTINKYSDILDNVRQ